MGTPLILNIEKSIVEKAEHYIMPVGIIRNYELKIMEFLNHGTFKSLNF
jgi:hypothetical protein